MEKTPTIQALRPLARKLLLWALRIAAVAIVLLVASLGYYMWSEHADHRFPSPKSQKEKPDFRDIGQFDINDTVTHHQEAVRWVNLFLDDIIITSNHPHPLPVESAPAAEVLSDVAPDDAPSREGHAMSASEGEPPPVHRQKPHYESDDDDDDDAFRRRLSFQISLQGFKRFGAMVTIPLGSRWSLETGLSYGHLNTEGDRNSCFAIPVKAIYDIKSIGPVNLYALGGGMVEKVCKGGTSLQLLLRAGIGAEYPFSEKWSVFLEPSLRYHIGNDINIPDLYGKRLGMNIHLGVSFTP